METNIVTHLSATISFNVEEHNEDIDINTKPIHSTKKIMDFCLQG
jgi:hypothetical protein